MEKSAEIIMNDNEWLRGTSIIPEAIFCFSSGENGRLLYFIGKLL